MTTITIDNELEEYPQEVFFADDDSPLLIPEEELMSLEEFKAYFEKRLFERLGLKITL